MNCFNDPKPLFIALKNETFIIDRNPYNAISCIIQKAQASESFFRITDFHSESRGSYICSALNLFFKSDISCRYATLLS